MEVTMSSKARSTLMGVTAALMIAAPVAQAIPLDPGQTNRPAHIGPLPSSTPSGATEYGDLRRHARTSSLAGTTSPRPAIRPAQASGGFDWLSAAFGAAAAAALALVSGTALGIRRIARA
jgi:hypothetical protein